MKTVRYLAVGLLLLTGLLHVVQIITATIIDAAVIIAVTFGIIYLALGLLLIKGGRAIVWLAAIVPLVGLILAGVGMLMKPTLLGALFMAIDIGISACCFTLLFRKSHQFITQGMGHAK